MSAELAQSHQGGSPEGAGTEGRVSGQGDESATQGELGTQVESSGSEGRESSEYEQRVMQGGEEALKEVKAWQRKFGQANSRLEKMKGIEPFISMLGGPEAAEEHLKLYSNLLNDDQGRGLIQRYHQTGRIAPPASEENEDAGYEDPLEIKLRELQSQQDVIRRELNGDRTSRETERVTTLFTKVLSDFPGLSEEMREKAFDGAQADIKGFGLTDEGLKTLAHLNEEGARAMMLRHLTPKELQEAAHASYVALNEERQSLATHERPGTTTQGAGDGAPVTSALEAVQQARRLASMGRL